MRHVVAANRLLTRAALNLVPEFSAAFSSNFMMQVLKDYSGAASPASAGMPLRDDCASISFPRKAPRNPSQAEERRTADRNQTLPSPPAGQERDQRLHPGRSLAGPGLGRERCSKQTGRCACPAARPSTAAAEMRCWIRRWPRTRRSGRSKLQGSPREHPRPNPSRRRRPGAPSRHSTASPTPGIGCSGCSKALWKQHSLQESPPLPDSRKAAVPG